MEKSEKTGRHGKEKMRTNKGKFYFLTLSTNALKTEKGTVNYIRSLNIDEPLGRIKSDGTVRYYQQDALGSVISLTTENGQLATSYIYDPFGSVSVIGEPSDNPFQFAGRENDGTGLLF